MDLFGRLIGKPYSCFVIIKKRSMNEGDLVVGKGR